MSIARAVAIIGQWLVGTAATWLLLLDDEVMRRLPLTGLEVIAPYIVGTMLTVYQFRVPD